MFHFQEIDTGALNDADTPWMPFAPYDKKVLLKYFKIDPVHGEVITLLKAPAGHEMARHHHTGTVIVYTVQGAWKYKEHDWTSRAGGVVYETASTRHTPQALPGDEDIITFNIVRGELIYLDDQDRPIAVENWKTSMDRYLAYCEAQGLEPRDLSAFRG
jgi:2,4'-dihydroxyacetophenone dioxygenase